jgi:chaperone required for assembly of F1-ATPase
VKRFWKEVDVRPDDGGLAILLDGKPMRLPSGEILSMQHVPLAEAIADEWRRAGTDEKAEVSFADTPLTRLAGTAQVRIAPNPEPTADAIARYGETDLLCYRAETPPALVDRQVKEWQPWLDWAGTTLGAPLRVTAGVSHIRQHRDSIATLRAAVSSMDAHALTALGIAVPALGSLVLGLALSHRQLTPEDAHRLSALDELFQEELWGADDEAVQRRAGVAADIRLASRYLALTREAA